MTLTAAVAAVVDNNSKAAVVDDNNSTSDGTSDGKTVTATTVMASVTATSEQSSIGRCIIWEVHSNNPCQLWDCGTDTYIDRE